MVYFQNLLKLKLIIQFLINQFYQNKFNLQVFLIILLFYNCNKIDKNDKIILSDSSPIYIKNFNIIFETSASMRGYFEGNQFKENVSNLISKIDNIFRDTTKDIRFENINYYTLDDSLKLKKYSQNAYDFTTKINNLDFDFSKNSPIADMIKFIVDSCSSNEINLIVSDFVIDVKGPSVIPTLSGKFTTIFNEAKSKDLALLIYRFTSDFNGFYYPALGGKIKVKNIERPYFFWIIGEKNTLKRFRFELLKSVGLMPLNEATFGIDFTDLKSKILALSNRYGQWKIKDNILYKAKLKNNKLKFTIGLNFDNFPLFFYENDFIKKNLVVESSSLKIDSVFLYTKDDFREIANLKEKQIINDFSHFLEINISAINEQNNEIEIYLRKGLIEWPYNYSTENDISLENGNNLKTFTLSKIIEGIANSFDEFDRNSKYFNTKIVIQK